ncbi:TPA: MarR family transcriptional regulator [Candidatus Galligastranaerophilus intestinavium]|uniref:MarR family transcriptional regulator n=1 Tax=Candidatus Galligastranaerophilus intestinavium TaxID=2840836 RepID=A0A9D1JYH0_9BACT|nr:MarR family transcriptional regulator [Candidatus Galligastranaerophilus intestinavium]
METKSDIKIMHYTDSPSYELELTSKYCKALLTQLFNKVCSEITPEEFAVLDTLCCNKGLCQRDLAKLILRDRANTGRVLDSLEKKGFVVRHNDVKNNRLIRRADITQSGLEILNDLTLRFQPIHEKMCKIFSNEDIMILRASLKKMRHAISQIVDMHI